MSASLKLTVDNILRIIELYRQLSKLLEIMHIFPPETRFNALIFFFKKLTSIAIHKLYNVEQNDHEA